MEENDSDDNTTETSGGYRRSSLIILFSLLTFWFVASFGCGILFREQLDATLSVGNAPFGFWMAQQGSIICFVVILILYAILMGRLDERHGYGDHSNSNKKDK